MRCGARGAGAWLPCAEMIGVLVKVLGLLVAIKVVAAYERVVPAADLGTSPYPEWAHYHWVWLSSDRANQQSMIDYAEEYMNYGIKVGAVDIDSGWSTGYNNFIFNTDKYPNATEMINQFHSKNIRVLLWTTSMVDDDSPNFQEAYDNGYLIRDFYGKQAIISWWHGKGGLIDYTNEHAVEWWHKQMNKALSLDIDGWKCDGTDPYILKLVVARGKKGIVTRREYSDAYYGDYFDYTRQILGDDRLIMSRPVDGLGPIFLDYSPKRVMYSGWVGDDDPTFEGLQSALKSYLQSAWAGYANFGSDIGGYRSGKDSGNDTLGRTKELFIRWAQLGSFSPLMENGGNKEHRPWVFDTTNETLNIYKKFVDTHYQLVPYLLSTGAEAFETNSSSITPFANHESFVDKVIDYFNPSTYNYLLGKSILVAPIISNDTTAFKVDLPKGNSWVYWWNHSITCAGGSSFHFNGSVPLDEFPVFFVNGSFIPLRVGSKTAQSGKDASHILETNQFNGYIRWLLHSPAVTQDAVTYRMREERGHGIIASYWWPTENTLIVNITSHPRQQSLIHLAGLMAVPKVVQTATPDDSLQDVPTVDSEDTLFAAGKGHFQQWFGGYYHLLVNPGNKGHLGHSVHFHF